MPQSEPSENENLMKVKIATQWKNSVDFFKTAINYYGNFRFCKIDLSLLLLYFGNNPFTISRDFLRSIGEEDVYAFGETPLATMDFIARECQLSKNDTVFELGCGRGRTCFWLNSFLGCKAVGIDFIPQFIDIANTIKKRYAVNDVEFRLEDMFKTSLDGATAIYLYGTNLKDRQIINLIDRFKELPVGTKIITISYPLTDYTSEPLFEVMKHFTAQFTWGEADVYFQVRKDF